MKNNLKNLVRKKIERFPLSIQLASALLFIGGFTTLPERFNHLYNARYNAPTAIAYNNYNIDEKTPKYFQNLNKPLDKENF